MFFGKRKRQIFWDGGNIEVRRCCTYACGVIIQINQLYILIGQWSWTNGYRTYS